MDTANRVAFLTMIARSEGTANSPATKQNGYDVIVTGLDGWPEIFTDFSHHPFDLGRPPKVINRSGLLSTASGRYQILLRYWRSYQQLLRLPDFSQSNQDAVVFQMLRERHALAAVDAGHFDDAIRLASGLWASLPGRQYVGQHQNSIVALRAIYEASGGVCTA